MRNLILSELKTARMQLYIMYSVFSVDYKSKNTIFHLQDLKKLENMIFFIRERCSNIKNKITSLKVVHWRWRCRSNDRMIGGVVPMTVEMLVLKVALVQ